MSEKTAVMTRIGVCAACLCVLSQVTLPMPSGVPLTLQTFAVALVAAILGSWRGSLCVLVYLIIGAVGLPVFSGFSGGLAKFAGPTGGFLIGFLPMAFLSGTKKNMATGFAGLLVCHILGTAWFSVVAGVSFLQSAVTVSIPYIIKDALSVLAALVLSKRIVKQLGITRR